MSCHDMSCRRHLDGKATRLEITVFVLESDCIFFFQKLNSGQHMNRKVNILVKRFYSTSLKNEAGLESVQLGFYFPYICLYIFFP